LVRLALLEIEALVSDDGPTALDERERALLAFVRGALAAPERVTADQVESLRRLGFVDGDILDALAHSRPPGFGEMNRFERLGRSLFSASSTEAPDGRPRLKLPFTVVGDEATKFHDPEVKVSGFGPFFGGAFLLSVVAFLLARGQQGTLAAGLCGAALLGTVLLTAEGWWARIAPQLWLVPFVLALPALVSCLVPGTRHGATLRHVVCKFNPWKAARSDP
jgi:hypothetical protein